jgi:hypothetical protein
MQHIQKETTRCSHNMGQTVLNWPRVVKKTQPHTSTTLRLNHLYNGWRIFLEEKLYQDHVIQSLTSSFCCRAIFMKLRRGHFVPRNNSKPRCEFVLDKGIKLLCG